MYLPCFDFRMMVGPMPLRGPGAGGARSGAVAMRGGPLGREGYGGFSSSLHSFCLVLLTAARWGRGSLASVVVLLPWIA